MTLTSHFWRVVSTVTVILLLGGTAVVVATRPTLTLRQTDFDRADLTVSKRGSPVANEHVTVQYGGVALDVTTNATGRSVVHFPECDANLLEERKEPVDLDFFRTQYALRAENTAIVQRPCSS